MMRTSLVSMSRAARSIRVGTLVTTSNKQAGFKNYHTTVVITSSSGSHELPHNQSDALDMKDTFLRRHCTSFCCKSFCGFPFFFFFVRWMSHAVPSKLYSFLSFICIKWVHVKRMRNPCYHRLDSSRYRD